ncbi:MAG: IclR family transcriptional regulator [Paenibacillaceae bacterium]
MSVKSATRVLDIFELLSQYPNGLNIKEISEQLSFPQSSTFNLVQTLSVSGYLTQTQVKKYKLGPKLIQIGVQAMESLDLSSEAQPYLAQLMEKVNETVFMAVVSGKELVYVFKLDSNRSIRTSAQIGSSKPLYCTGLGKAYLAFTAPEERERLLADIEMTAITPKTITERQTLEDQLKQFREMGFSIDDEESEEGLFCLAAPVFGANGSMTAAVSVAGPKERVFTRKEEISRELLSAALKISERLRYT